MIKTRSRDGFRSTFPQAALPFFTRGEAVLGTLTPVDYSQANNEFSGSLFSLAANGFDFVASRDTTVDIEIRMTARTLHFSLALFAEVDEVGVMASVGQVAVVSPTIDNTAFFPLQLSARRIPMAAGQRLRWAFDQGFAETLAEMDVREIL